MSSAPTTEPAPAGFRAGRRGPGRTCRVSMLAILLSLSLLSWALLSGCRPREEAVPSAEAQDRATRGGLLDLLELARLTAPRLGQREEEYRRALEGSAATVRAFEFETAGEAEGWRAAAGCTDLRVEGGVLRVRAAGDDCQVELPAGFDAAQARRLEVRLRATAGTRGQLFWRGDGESYSEARSYRFQLLPDGLFHDYTLELGERGEWAGRIAGLRFDPLDAPGNVEIESFRFLRGLPSRERDLLAARSLIPGASLELEGDRRPAILVPAGGEVVFTLRLPPAAAEGERAGEKPAGRPRRGPFLRLASGVVQAAATQGGPLRLTLRVEAGGEEKLLLDRVLDAHSRPADRGWHDHCLSLARYGGRVVRLTLGASAAGEEKGSAASFAAWANPLIDPGGEGRGGVLLVLVDTLRADRMGLYGHGRRTSPNLDRWSRQGITCRQAVSACSWTSPSVASCLTGLLPYRHGVRYVNRLELEGKFQTLAESFAQAGWFTGAFSDSRLIIPANGFGQGFRTFGERPEGSPELGAALLTRQAIAWLGQHGDLPFFLYLHYMDPHGPYAPPAPYHPGPFPGPRGAIGEDAERGRVGGIVARMQRDPAYRPSTAERQWLTTLYDGEVATTDHHLGRLLAWMQQRGLLEGTTVVLLADHGEEFGDRGKYSHATSLHEEQVRVPLLLLPAAGLGLPRGAGCPAVVRTVDLPATLLEMAGLPAAAGEGDGLSLLSLLRSGGQAPEEAYSEMNPYTVGPLSAGWFEPARGLRLGDLKLLYSPREERYRLYDLGADPGEAHDIYREADPRSSEMVERLGRHLRAGGAGEEPGAPAFLEENRLRQLEALGYLGP